MTISEAMLAAYADGELDASARAAVEAAAAADPKIAQRLEQHRALRNRLQSSFSDILNEPVPPRLFDAVRGVSHPEKITDLAAARVQRMPKAGRRWAWREWTAMAASLLAGVILGHWLLRQSSGGGFMESQHGRLLARGDLAIALSHQLASEQPRHAAVRIGISFPAKADGFCRTFELRDGRQLAGLACRTGGDWQVQVLAHQALRTGADGAEPAGSELPGAVLKMVDETMAGEPLDAAQEAAARNNRWRR